VNEVCTFTGALGLAQHWIDRRLDPKGQRWVSACLLARVNFHDQAEAISLRGLAPELTVNTDEQEIYTVEEGAFFGNLSTDDEGVSRIDLTHEYTRAALEYHLGYLDLKKMARTSLEHSFLPGESLWQKLDEFTRVNAACASQKLGAESPTGPCLRFLKGNERAEQQWELEHRFAVFESTIQ